MLESKTREKVLKRLRHALLHKTPAPHPEVDFESPLYADGDLPELMFARQFTSAGGRFVFCESIHDLRTNLAVLAVRRKWGAVQAAEAVKPHADAAFGGQPLPGDLPVAILDSEGLAAATGEVLVADGEGTERSVSMGPGDTVVVVSPDRVYADMREAMQMVAERYRTALPAMLTSLNGGETLLRESAGQAGALYLMLVDES